MKTWQHRFLIAFLFGLLLWACSASERTPLNGLGYPVVSNEKVQVLQRKGYTAGYSAALKIPRWVAWQLTAEHAQAAQSRHKPARHYREDSEVPKPRATLDDYRGASKALNLSRGHMCPAADCKWDAQAFDESNLLTNMCPQDAATNSGMWNRIEIKCRQWAVRYGEVYVVTGPILYHQKHVTIGKNKVTVPEGFYKVVLRLGSKPACIAWVCKNGDRGKNGQYINTLEQVERITGLKFFPQLDPKIRNRIASTAQEKDW
ncbi:MAG: DNA/RNA non-specific endonuclease [Muribaculaceae bacterium]|nr:DNA/RNA non-specific endonuclease [Muribaculaceae bacterium]